MKIGEKVIFAVNILTSEMFLRTSTIVGIT